jgi:3-hydroxyacyl-[acyl-carrier-protein] dehydratase
LIENIAQTCAAGFGYQDSLSGGEPKVGFIGAVSKLQVYALPNVDTRISTRVVITHQLGTIFLAKGENFQDGKCLLDCEVKIVVN